MFLDVCYAVRELFAGSFDSTGKRNKPKIQVNSQYTTLISVLPTVFEKEVDRATFNKFQRNAYACLLEMEHYGTPGTDDQLLFAGTSSNRNNRTGFIAPWENGNFIPGAGWHSCYLIDNTNPLSPHKPLGIGETYRMIADYLFMDYAKSDFAIKKRSNRCNLSQFQGNILRTNVRKPVDSEDTASLKVDPDVVFATQNGCTFSSFGLAEINFNRNRVYRAASYRLARHLVSQRWLSRADSLPESKYKAETKSACYDPKPNAEQTNPPSFRLERLTDRLFDTGSANWRTSAAVDFSNARNQSFITGTATLRQLLTKHDGLLGPGGGGAPKLRPSKEALWKGVRMC